MKKVISLMLTLLLFNSFFPLGIFAAEEQIITPQLMTLKLNENITKQQEKILTTQLNEVQATVNNEKTNKVVVKSGTEICLSPRNTITSENEPAVIPAVVKEDVVINGKLVFKEGGTAQINISDVEKAGFLGNGGRMVLGNGYVTDTNGNKIKVSYNYIISGKDKTWPKVTCVCGILLWPLLLFGFVKGGEAKVLNTLEMNVVTNNDFTI